MHNDPSNLITAVSMALGRQLNKNRFNDRLLMQKGCYILNRWGYGPEYRYSLYIRGPYSPDLADDYYELNRIGEFTDVPAERIEELSTIMSKGIGYTEAYTTVLIVKQNNPDRTNEELLKKALDVKPHLKKEVMEVWQSVLNQS